MIIGHNDCISCLGFYDLNVFAHIIILCLGIPTMYHSKQMDFNFEIVSFLL